jgi:hypothetical protein
VEDRDGIGGEMVLARKWMAAAGRSRGTETKTVNPGKAKLIAALDKKIGEKSGEMADKLVNDFLAGKETSMKMLNALADELINCEDPVVMSQLCGYAERLEKDRQLTDAEVAVEEKKREEADKKVISTLDPPSEQSSLAGDPDSRKNKSVSRVGHPES